MTTIDAEAAILLGVPPHGRLSDGTISFVVDTAERLDLGIELMHVVPTMVGGATGTFEVGVAFEALVADGRAGLDQAMARVRDRAGDGVPLEATLVRGGVVPTLVERSRSAQLVVLEHRHTGRWQRISEGSVTSGVAARAHSPVVSVPAGWHPAHRDLPVTVGVEDAKRAQAEVWTALAMAAATDVPLRLLRVAYLSEAHQEILRREVNKDDLLLVAREELERDADLPESVREQVPCTFEVRWGKPAEVLVEATSASSLVVVARRDPVLPFGSHLGPVVRQLLQAAEGPVMVIEPTLERTVVPEPASLATAVRG